MNYLKKNWKIVLIGILIIALSVVGIKLQQQIKINESLPLQIESLKKILEENSEVFKKNSELIEELQQREKEHKIIIVTTKDFYEKIKKSPAKTNYTSSDIAEWLKSYESNNSSKK